MSFTATQQPGATSLGPGGAHARDFEPAGADFDRETLDQNPAEGPAFLLFID
jgi:hypothetical protein